MSLGRETEDAIAQPKFKGDDIADGLGTKRDLNIARTKPEDAMNCAILTPSKGYSNGQVGENDSSTKSPMANADVLELDTRGKAGEPLYTKEISCDRVMGQFINNHV